MIHKEQFAFQAHALRITMKLGFWGTWAGCCLVKCVSFRVLRRKAQKGVGTPFPPPGA